MPTEMTEALNVGAEWFNMVVGPIGILILGLTAIGPLLPFKVGPNKATKRQLAWSGAVTLSVALTIAVMFLAIRSNQFSTNTGIPTGEAMVIYLKSMSWAGPYALFAIWFGLWTIATLTVDWIDSIKRKKGMNPLKASIKLFVDNPKRFGGHLVHLGVALSFIGFAGEAGKLLQKNVVLEPMEGIVLGSQEVTFIGSFEHWQPAEGYASVKSAFLVRPIKASIRPKVLASVAKQVDAVSVEPGDGSEVVITLKSEQQAAALRAEIAASTSWANDYRLVRSDPENLEIQLAPAQLETLRVVPQSFNRRVRAAQALASELGNRISVTPGRGEPVINIKADDQTIFDALIAGMESTNHPWLASMIDTENPLKVKTLVQGVGSVLTPEIRFYLKSENPTTEVAIESSLLSDLYLAASPGQGSEAVNLTVMQNPLMASLWVGSLVLLVFGTLLVVPFRGSKKVSTVEEVGVAVEEQC
jgi:cytochrome c biogenesis factor